MFSKQGELDLARVLKALIDAGDIEPRPGFRGAGLVDHGPAGVRQGYAKKKNLPPIKKKAPARLEFYEFLKKNPNIKFKTAQDLLKKANILTCPRW